MLMGLLVASSASTTPPNDSGSDNRIVTGWATLPNSRISTPKTIMRPVPMAVMKPVATSSWISASPEGCSTTLGGRFCSSTTLMKVSRALDSA